MIPHIDHSMGSDVSPSSRITLMIGWWGKGVSTTPSPSSEMVSTSSFSPNMKLPTRENASWISLLSPLPITPQISNICQAPLISVRGDIWEPVPENKTGIDLQDPDVVFVGNWFLKSRTEILDEIFSPTRLVSSVPDAVEWISLEDLEKLRN